MCNKVTDDLQALPVDPNCVTILSNGLEVDELAVDRYPDDVPDKRTLYPCKTKADGNCLPSTGSIFAYGDPNHTSEMRVRILHELVLHKDMYLDNDFLSRGCVQDASCQKQLPRVYAQYSDMHVPGMLLDERTIENIFIMETLKIRLDRSYMGIWQIHALSSVLNAPVFSIYPKLGNPNVRLDLNRVVLPRNYVRVEVDPVYIFWTSTRSDMTSTNWIPNHFVAVVPIYVCRNGEESTDYQQKKQHIEADHMNKIEEDGTSKNKGVQEKKELENGVKQQVESDQESNSEHASDMSKMEDDGTSENLGVQEKKELGNGVKQHVEADQESDTENIESYLGKYVVVSYNGNAYPGFVKEIGYEDIYVSCMHQIGRKKPIASSGQKKVLMNAGILWITYWPSFQSQKS